MTDPLEKALKSAGKFPIGIAPVINNPTPNQVVRPAKVIIKGGSFPFVIPKAWMAPTAKPLNIVAIMETEIGYHIIKLLEVEDAVQPSLADVRDEVEQLYRMYATEDEFVTRSSRLAEMLFEAIDLEAPAAELGLELLSTGSLPRESKNFLIAQ